MKVNLKTSYDTLLERATEDGICPECGEHTSLFESCCGNGAIVCGSKCTEIIEEDLDAEKNEPYVSVKLLVDAPSQVCQTVSKALHQAGISSNFYSTKVGEDKWNVTVFVPVKNLNQVK